MVHNRTQATHKAIAVIIFTALFTLAAQARWSDAAVAQEEGNAVVIVQFDDHAASIRPIQITEPISGLAALEQSELAVVTADSGFGPAVCSIEGVGCPVDNCFCDAEQFWAYSSWDGALWQPYEVGAGASIVEAGAIEGWRWGPFESPQTPATTTLAAQTALDWLAAAHDPDGSLEGSVAGTIETLLALGANRLDAHAWPSGEGQSSAAAYVTNSGAPFAALGPAESGKLATALAATASCWPTGAPRPTDYYDEDLGAYSSETGFHLWALLGALALGDDVPAAAVQTVLHRAQPDGGWEWSAGWGTDTNTTALAVQALRAAGLPTDAPTIQAAIEFFRSAQIEDGGFVYDPTGADQGSDVNSTAYAIQGLIAAGEEPASWRVKGISPIDYLLRAQSADGSFEWQPNTGANSRSTQQAAVALLGATLPARVGEPLPPCRAPTWPTWFETLIRLPLTTEQE